MITLPVRLQAMVSTDALQPIISAFLPQVYLHYTPEQYLESLQWIHPLLEEQPFVIHKIENKENGTLYSFKTTSLVVEYIRKNNFRLQHGLGQTIFNQKMEFENPTSVLTAEPPAKTPQITYYQDEAMQEDPPAQRPPQEPPINKDNSSDGLDAFLDEQELWLAEKGFPQLQVTHELPDGSPFVDTSDNPDVINI